MSRGFPIAGGRGPVATLATVVDRSDVVAWLEGPGRRPAAGGAHPGQRLGLSAQGSGSVARVGRRLVAVTVDWMACLLISNALLGGNPWATLGVFGALHVLTLGTVGSSPGHRLLGLRLQRVGGGWAGPVPALVRTVLLCLVIPALVFDVDQRGLHDRAAGTLLIRR